MGLILKKFLEIGRCPRTGKAFEVSGEGQLSTSGPSPIVYRQDERGIYLFNSGRPLSKYDDPEYVKDYIPYAFGSYFLPREYCTGTFVGHGFSEGLYRATGHLVIEALHHESSKPSFAGAQENVLFLGCGLGRCALDLSRIAPAVNIFAVDASVEMLRAAHQIVCGSDRLQWTFPKYSDKSVTLQGFARENVLFLQADAVWPPFAQAEDGGAFDVVVSEMLIDRLTSVEHVELSLAVLRRLLKKNVGRAILTTACNWASAETWESYGSRRTAIIDAVTRAKLAIWSAFDGLPYAENQDRFGMRLELPILCLGLRAAGEEEGDTHSD